MIRRRIGLEQLEHRLLFEIDVDLLGTFGGGPRPSDLIQHDDVSHADVSSPRAPISAGGKSIATDKIRKNIDPNLSITSGTLADGFGIPQTILLVGQQMVLRAEWSTQDLPATRYTVGFYFDGIRVDSSSIVGQSGSWNYWWYRYGSFASPGSHTLSILLDPDNLIAETNETDNFWTTTISTVVPTDLPMKLANPIGRNANRDWAINNYADVDPRTNSAADYRGGPYQYDGHDAMDAGPWGFNLQDAGIPLYAAADGVVDAVLDGNPDRETTFGNRAGNYVQVDHGNGFKTLYYHFATNSIVVQAGQRVTTGQLLGQMGSSGISTGTHVHYTLLYRGAAIERGYSPGTYDIASLPYGGDVPQFFFDAGVTNNFVNADVQEKLSENVAFPVGISSGTIYFWLQSYNLNAGQNLTWQYYRPNGTLFGQNTATVSTSYRSSWWYWSRNLSNFSSVPGTWEVRYLVDGIEQARRNFRFESVGSPSLRVENTSLGGGTIIDGRTTPIPFGTVAAGSTGPIRSFTIQNHGTSPLLITDVKLPPGFVSVGNNPTSIAAGGSFVWSIRMQTQRAQDHLGTVSFSTNDPDIGLFAFNLSGTVTSSSPATTPTISSAGPAVAYTVGGEPAILAPNAIVSANKASFNGMKLQIDIMNDQQRVEVLGVGSQGNRTESVRLVGNQVYVGQLVIGTYRGDIKGSIGFTFNNNASVSSVEVLVRSLTYRRDDSTALTFVRRYVRFSLISPQLGTVSYAISNVIPTGRKTPAIPTLALPQIASVGTMPELSRNNKMDTSASEFTFAAALEQILLDLDNYRADGRRNRNVPRRS